MNIKKFFGEIKYELSQTTFPSRAVVTVFTVFVVIFSAVMALYLAGLDLGFGEIVISGISKLK